MDRSAPTAGHRGGHDTGFAHLDDRTTGPGLLAGATGVERVGWVTGAAAGMGLFLTVREFMPMAHARSLLMVGVAGALMVVAGWILSAFRSAPRP